MRNIFDLKFFLIFQDAGSPTSFYVGFAGIAFLLGLLIGIVITFIFFYLKPNNLRERSENPFLKLSEPPKTIQVASAIKHCPQCNSTYTDEELIYCLRDGALLKNVGFMPVSDDPEKTLVRLK